MINSKLKTHNSQLRGQASLEYFILFSVITVLTLLSLSSFFRDVKASGEGFFKEAVARIIR